LTGYQFNWQQRSTNRTGGTSFRWQKLWLFFLSYILGRIMAMAGRKAPSLSVYAKNIIEIKPSVDTVLLSHTHDPEQKKIIDNKRNFNTGTWIPIFEISPTDVRLYKTFTLIAVNCTLF
jgi:hypothetical protein